MRAAHTLHTSGIHSTYKRHTLYTPHKRTPLLSAARNNLRDLLQERRNGLVAKALLALLYNLQAAPSHASVALSRSAWREGAAYDVKFDLALWQQVHNLQLLCPRQRIVPEEEHQPLDRRGRHRGHCRLTGQVGERLGAA